MRIEIKKHGLDVIIDFDENNIDNPRLTFQFDEKKLSQVGIVKRLLASFNIKLEKEKSSKSSKNVSYSVSGKEAVLMTIDTLTNLYRPRPNIEHLSDYRCKIVESDSKLNQITWAEKYTQATYPIQINEYTYMVYSLDTLHTFGFHGNMPKKDFKEFLLAKPDENRDSLKSKKKFMLEHNELFGETYVLPAYVCDSEESLRKFVTQHKDEQLVIFKVKNDLEGNSLGTIESITVDDETLEYPMAPSWSEQANSKEHFTSLFIHKGRFPEGKLTKLALEDWTINNSAQLNLPEENESFSAFLNKEDAYQGGKRHLVAEIKVPTSRLEQLKRIHSENTENKVIGYQLNLSGAVTYPIHCHHVVGIHTIKEEDPTQLTKQEWNELNGIKDKKSKNKITFFELKSNMLQSIAERKNDLNEEIKADIAINRARKVIKIAGLQALYDKVNREYQLEGSVINKSIKKIIDEVVESNPQYGEELFAGNFSAWFFSNRTQNMANEMISEEKKFTNGKESQNEKEEMKASLPPAWLRK